MSFEKALKLELAAAKKRVRTLEKVFETLKGEAISGAKKVRKNAISGARKARKRISNETRARMAKARKAYWAARKKAS